MPKKTTQKQAPAAEAAQATMHRLPLAAIAESPNNPRTHFDQAAIDELAESIKAVGIIQPIVVRPDADGYEIVCGARRFRAAHQAGLEEIPAVVRTLTDEEAFDLAITENLQRKDVNPLDEAVALLRMKERGYSIKEQAAKLGKSESYVVQRLKLNDLIEPLKEALFAGKLLVSHANMLARISAGDQQTVYDNFISKLMKREDFEARDISNLENNIAQVQRKLSDARFDIEDPNIYPSAGPCTSCPKNTACATLLFPDMDQGQARCTDSKCWDAKTGAAIDAALSLVKNNPDTYFLVSYYSRRNTTPKAAITNAVTAAGLDIKNFLDSSQFTTFHKPEPPDEVDVEQYKYDPDLDEDSWQEYDSHEEAAEALVEAQKQFEEEMRDYEAELQQYNEAMASGKFMYGFILEGRNEGTIVPITLRNGKAGTGITASGSSAAEDGIEQQIAGIEAREKRAKELDAEKIHAQLVEKFASHKALSGDSYQTQNDGFEHEHLQVTAYLLYESVNYVNKKDVCEFLGLERYASNEEVWQTIRNFVPEYLPSVVNYLTHVAAFGKWRSHLPQHSGGMVLRHLINQHLDNSAIAAVEAEFKEKADKRAARAAERIEALKSKL